MRSLGACLIVGMVVCACGQGAA
ncbi:MAG: hypothetical protein QOI66_5276, partial [Myxococcales bacterium]|nr:hypothetical protein [Myxococcales bacterium]